MPSSALPIQSVRNAPKGIPRLNGSVAVVTGAAHGIGRALSVALLGRGCHLALVDLDEEHLSGVHRDLQASAPDRRVSMHVADVADRERMRQLVNEVVQMHGVVHVLVNNAGVAYEAPFSQTSLDDWDRIVAVNLMGVIHGCHFFLPHLAKVDRAHIVNLSSLLGRHLGDRPGEDRHLCRDRAAGGRAVSGIILTHNT